MKKQTYMYADKISRQLAHMKHKELQAACILRGMPSQEVVDADHHRLVSWYYNNHENPEVLERLTLHDIWVETQLKDRGYKKGDVMLSPALKFGISGDLDKMPSKVVVVKPNNAKKVVIEGVKPKSEINPETGVRSGTKKAMTYTLTLEDKPIDFIIKAVTEAFPGADPKSIKIWHKRALKQRKS